MGARMFFSSACVSNMRVFHDRRLPPTSILPLTLHLHTQVHLSTYPLISTCAFWWPMKPSANCIHLPTSNHIYTLNVHNRFVRSRVNDTLSTCDIIILANTHTRYRLSQHFTLSTSNVAAPFLKMFCFGPVVADGYGIGYMVCCVRYRSTS